MIERIGVVGVGQMGSGIAEISSRAGYDTKFAEIDAELLKTATEKISRSMKRAHKKGRISDQEFETATANLHPVASLDEMADRDLVIEAVAENMDVKREIFGELDRVCPDSTILASNTSSFSIVAIGAATERPNRVLGLHFFNPVQVMKLVELVPGIATDEAVVNEARAFAEALGKRVVTVRDTPGFVVNRLLVPFMLDGMRLFESGVASMEDIDAGFTQGAGHPMGPITLADYVGLDVVYQIAETLHAELGELRFKPPVMLKQLYLSNRLGRKTGRGFYDYSKGDME